MSRTLSLQARIGSDEIPLYGLGTWQLPEEQVIAPLTEALQEKYQLIDTASFYNNEKEVGDVILQQSIPRESLFIISKLDMGKHSYEGALESVHTSLKNLQTSYIDLYLIHSPRPGNILATWKGLIEAKKQGLVSHIGVSNFSPEQMKWLEKETGKTIEANEIELHLWNQQFDCVNYCTANNILIIGYCPLARGRFFGQNDIVTRIAKKHNTNEATVALAWSLQRGYVTIPKTERRIKENIEKLDQVQLDEDDLRDLTLVNQDVFVSSAGAAAELSVEAIC